MLLKVAVRNVRRSARDFAIYFLTIVFGVAVFYAFNSIGSQRVLFDLEASSATWFETIDQFMGIFSLVVALVLGFLVVYANRFLVRRRKREFGTYLLLGMSAGSVSFIVLCETALVGAVSLAVGLAAGVALSQALSFATAGLFGFMMSDYQFVFSADAAADTAACFALIFLAVAAVNLFAVNRFKLIDLLYAASRSEKAPVRNPWICTAAFLLAMAALAQAYWYLQRNGLLTLDEPDFALATALMLAGTFLLFWSIAGFIVALASRAGGLYLRGLRPFTVRQLATKVNTAYVSLWAVTVTLFFGMTAFSVGLGVSDVLSGEVEAAAPFDATLRADVYYDEALDADNPSSASDDERRSAMEKNDPDVYALADAWNFNALAKLEAQVEGWDDTVRSAAEIDYYEVADETFGPYLEVAGGSTGLETADTQLAESNLVVVPLSQFNAVRALTGQDAVVLDEGECVLNNTLSMSADLSRALAEAGTVFTVAGHELSVQSQVLTTQTSTSAMASAAVEIVVPDGVIDELRERGAIPLYSYVNVMYREPGEKSDAALAEGIANMYAADMTAGLYDAEWVEQINAALADGQMPITTWPVTQLYERTQMLAQAVGLKMLTTYLALYLGFVLLIATSAVLAVQQLSDTTDSLSRYRTLSHLGCDERAMERSLFTQVSLYFLLPLIVAGCHSAWVIHILNDTLFSLMGLNATIAVVVSVALTAALFGAYLLLTCLACREMVRNHLKRGVRHA